MLLQIILGVLVTALVTGIYKLKTMRPVDASSLVAYLMFKSGFLWFLNTTGLVKITRPKLIEITAPNGSKVKSVRTNLTTVLKIVQDLETRDDDVFIATYPKSGTTWVQEIVWLICNNVDTKRAKEKDIFQRSPFLELPDIEGFIKGLQSVENWPKNERRIIKTHMSCEFLPTQLKSGRGEKIIWVTRNPKDTCVSYYFFHVMNNMAPQPGSWDKFYANFCSGNVLWGDWFTYTLNYWEESQKAKHLYYIVTYEALKKDLRSEVVKMAKFLEKDLSDEQIDTITQHCTFGSMSKNKATNYSGGEKHGLDFAKVKFMRKGKVGDWKNHFTINQNEAFDELYRERMKGSELDFEFE